MLAWGRKLFCPWPQRDIVGGGGMSFRGEVRCGIENKGAAQSLFFSSYLSPQLYFYT